MNTRPQSRPEAELPELVLSKLQRFAECAEDGDSGGCDIGRDWFDALTTIGLLERTKRSPAIWTMTAAGEALIEGRAKSPMDWIIPPEWTDLVTQLSDTRGQMVEGNWLAEKAGRMLNLLGDHPPAYGQQCAATRTAEVGGDGWLPIESAPKDGSLFLCYVAAERWSQEDGEGSGRSADVSDFDFCQWRTHPETPEEGYFMNMMGQIGDTQDITHWKKLTPPAPGSEAKS